MSWRNSGDIDRTIKTGKTSKATTKTGKTGAGDVLYPRDERSVQGSSMTSVITENSIRQVRRRRILSCPHLSPNFLGEERVKNGLGANKKVEGGRDLKRVGGSSINVSFQKLKGPKKGGRGNSRFAKKG